MSMTASRLVDSLYPSQLSFDIGEGRIVTVGVEYTWKPNSCAHCKVGAQRTSTETLEATSYPIERAIVPETNTGTSTAIAHPVVTGYEQRDLVATTRNEIVPYVDIISNKFRLLKEVTEEGELVEVD
ncbi:hypothetical protein IFM89_026203 [Coptis chinensis]|uniref:Uncharacterized protein n=1 Tax=Coptis chinensis TaxID=261450 RepID=A0A835M9L3_9MAGN|nr:hypothetical protein IFM89_026203 [Coptis chinensis]